MPIRHLKLCATPPPAARVRWMLHEVVGDAVEIERADYLQMLRFAGTWGAWSIIRTKHLERRSNPA